MIKQKIKIKYPDLLFARLYYFIFMGSNGFILPFMNLFYTSLGFNGKQIGLIASTSAVIGLMAAPILVNEIKKRPNGRNYLQFLLVFGATGYFLISHQTTFLAIIIVIIFQALVSSSVGPLSDSMAVTAAKNSDAGYGSIRVLGSLGWIMIVPISGWLLERYGYTAGFNGVTIGWICAACMLFLVSNQNFGYTVTQTTAQKPGLWVTAKNTFNNRTLLGFAIALIATGFLNNGVQQFENVFLFQLGATKQLISFAGILSAIVELPFMLIADKIQRRFGPHRMLLIALLLTLAQRTTVLILPSIPTIMIVRFIGGVAFSFYTVSFIGLISLHTDPGETSTVLALFTVTLASGVTVIASPIAGALFDLIGARWLYTFSASGYAIAVISLWITRPSSINHTSR
ncbi:MAG: MFS transporter [Chloroflexota bacterium]